MSFLPTNIAKSLRPALALVLLAVVVVAVVATAAPKSLSVSVSPSSQAFTQGTAKAVAYPVTVANANGPTTLTAAGVPARATASWSGTRANGVGQTCSGTCIVLAANVTTATLTIQVPYDLTAGSYAMTLTALAQGNTSATTTATLTSSAAPAFTISGNATGSMTLDGPAQPIDVRVSNPHDHPLTVSGLSIAISSVSKAGCAIGNYTVTQVPAGTTYTVPANSTQVLGTPKPAIAWRNNPVQAQNACIGAVVSFSYSANGSV